MVLKKRDPSPARSEPTDDGENGGVSQPHEGDSPSSAQTTPSSSQSESLTSPEATAPAHAEERRRRKAPVRRARYAMELPSPESPVNPPASVRKRLSALEPSAKAGSVVRRRERNAVPVEGGQLRRKIDHPKDLAASREPRSSLFLDRHMEYERPSKGEEEAAAERSMMDQNRLPRQLRMATHEETQRLRHEAKDHKDATEVDETRDQARVTANVEDLNNLFRDIEERKRNRELVSEEALSSSGPQTARWDNQTVRAGAGPKPCSLSADRRAFADEDLHNSTYSGLPEEADKSVHTRTASSGIARDFRAVHDPALRPLLLSSSRPLSFSIRDGASPGSGSGEQRPYAKQTVTTRLPPFPEMPLRQSHPDPRLSERRPGEGLSPRHADDAASVTRMSLGESSRVKAAMQADEASAGYHSLSGATNYGASYSWQQPPQHRTASISYPNPSKILAVTSSTTRLGTARHNRRPKHETNDVEPQSQRAPSPPETRRSCARVSIPAPGLGLKRSTRTTYRNGSIRGREERDEFPSLDDRQSWRDPSTVYQLSQPHKGSSSKRSLTKNGEHQGPTSTISGLKDPTEPEFLSMDCPGPYEAAYHPRTAGRIIIPEDEVSAEQHSAKKVKDEASVCEATKRQRLPGNRDRRYFPRDGLLDDRASSSTPTSMAVAPTSCLHRGAQLPEPPEYEHFAHSSLAHRFRSVGPPPPSVAPGKVHFLRNHSDSTFPADAAVSAVDPNQTWSNISDLTDRLTEKWSPVAWQKSRKTVQEEREALSRESDPASESAEEPRDASPPGSPPRPEARPAHSELLRLRGVIVAHLLKRFYASPHSRQHTTSPSTSHAASSHASASFGLPPGKPKGQPKRKRASGKRDRGSASDSASEDDGTSRSKARPRPSSEDPALLWACPFSKWKPLSYQSCHAYTLKDISRVKQHLRRRHKIALHCPICYSPFSSELERDSHVRDRSCSAPDEGHGQGRAPEGVTMAQQDVLEKRVDKRLSKSEQWYSIYDILFPDHPRPESPYVEASISHHLRSFQNFLAGEGMGIVQGIARQHIPAALRPRETEVLDFTGTLFEHAIPELLQRFQASTAGSSSTAAATPASVSASTVGSTAAPTASPVRGSARGGSDGWRGLPEQTPAAESSSGRTGTTSLSPPGPSTTESIASPQSTEADWPRDPAADAGGFVGGRVMTDKELAEFAQLQSLDDGADDNGGGGGRDFDGYLQQFGWDLDAQMPLVGDFTHEVVPNDLDGYAEGPGDLYTTPWAHDQHGYLKNRWESRYAT